MTDIVERYIHQVGRYLPPKDRAEIEAELRSQIQDQLDDRYGGSPSQSDVTALLAELGHPYRIAASYSGDKYLVGPTLYPYMMLVLRYVWLLIPAIVVFLNLFGAVISPQPRPWLDVAVETVIAALQATLICSALAVLFFALIQHSYLKIDADNSPFDPRDLPKVDDPASVDRYEEIFGLTFGALFTLAMLYFLRVGGLTLRFDLNDPGDVLPVPLSWLVLLIVIVVAMLVVNLVALRRNRWTLGLWLFETLLEVVGAICLYFVFYVPVFARLMVTNPDLGDLSALPEIIVILSALGTLISRGSRAARLWAYRQNTASPFATRIEN